MQRDEQLHLHGCARGKCVGSGVCRARARAWALLSALREVPRFVSLLHQIVQSRNRRHYTNRYNEGGRC